MKKTLKQILVLALAVIMVLTVAACSGGNKTSSAAESKTPATSGTSSKADDLYYQETGYPICKKEITLTCTGDKGSTDDWSATDTIWYFKDNFGINLDCHEYSADEWPTKWTQMLSSDSLYDLIIYAKCSYADMVKYGNDGYFLDFGKYESLMPNYADFCKQMTGYDEFLRQPNKELWGFTIYNAQGNSSRSVDSYVNQNWLDNLGLSLPKTVDELYTVLTAFKEKDANKNGDANDEIPMTLNKTGDSTTAQMIMWGYGIKSRTVNYALDVDKDGKVFLADISDNYRDYLATMAKWYKEGLIDPYFQTREDTETLWKADQLGYTNSFSDQWWTAAKEAGIEINYWPVCSAWTQNTSDDRFTVLKDPMMYNGYINMLASSKTEYPEAVARLYDYMFDLKGEGCNSSLLGWEGVNYDLVEVMDKGYSTFDCTKYRGDKSNWDYRRNAWIYQAMCTAYLRDPSNWGLYDHCTTEELMDHTLTELTQFNFSNNGREVAVREDGLVFETSFPTLGYLTDESEVRKKYYTDILSTLKSYYISFITDPAADVTNDATWNEYVNKIKGMGLSELLAAEQTAYDRLKK